MQEFKDSRLELVEMGKIFHSRANDISITCKQHFRICEHLANRLSRERPKSPQDFEKNEHLKDFVFKSSQLNEKVIGILDFIQALINSIAVTERMLSDAKDKDVLRYQSESLEVLISQREKLVEELYNLKKNECRENTTNT